MLCCVVYLLMTYFISVTNPTPDAMVKLARICDMAKITSVLTFKIEDSAYRVVVLGRGLKYPQQKTLLLIVNDYVKGKMHSPWTDVCDWSQTKGVEWYSDLYNPKLLCPEMVLCQVDDFFLLLDPTSRTAVVGCNVNFNS